jgi:AraC-like DNA-binding protein
MNGSRVLAVQVQRAADLPGVEIRKVDRWSEQWRCYCRGFEFAVSQAWSGEVFLRGFRGEVRRGSVVACYPGEVYTTPKLHRAGSGYAVTIDADTLLQHLAAHGVAKTDLTLRRISKPSSRLARSLTRLLDAFDAEATASDRERSFVGFVAALAAELDRDTALSPLVARADECFDFVSAEPPDLDTLCARSGLSRFQALRQFKRRYGLPPHAYQLCVRIGFAQRALLSGASAAMVAAEYGFADQSHFSRHFKRIVGLTPAAYAATRSCELRAPTLRSQYPRAPRSRGGRACDASPALCLAT